MRPNETPTYVHQEEAKDSAILEIASLLKSAICKDLKSLIKCLNGYDSIKNQTVLTNASPAAFYKASDLKFKPNDLYPTQSTFDGNDVVEKSLRYSPVLQCDTVHLTLSSDDAQINTRTSFRMVKLGRTWRCRYLETVKLQSNTKL